MRHFKILMLLLLTGASSMFFNSCSNGGSKKYEPEILSTDRVIKCYTIGADLNDIINNTGSVCAYGNILLSQNGIIKAIQLDIEWLKVTYSSIDTYTKYYDEKTGRTFDYSADITYDNGLDERSVTIFWN